MNTPAPLTDEEIEPCIEKVWGSYAEFDEVRLFVRAIESARDTQWQKMMKEYMHYPECWDTAAYPTLESAMHENSAWFKCTNQDTHPAPDHTALLRQALEALEYHTAQTRPIQQTMDAITALKEALK